MWACWYAGTADGCTRSIAVEFGSVACWMTIQDDWDDSDIIVLQLPPNYFRALSDGLLLNHIGYWLSRTHTLTLHIGYMERIGGNSWSCMARSFTFVSFRSSLLRLLRSLTFALSSSELDLEARRCTYERYI